MATDWLTRLRLAWHVLRGQPTAYRLRISSGGLYVSGNAMVVECTRDWGT